MLNEYKFMPDNALKIKGFNKMKFCQTRYMLVVHVYMRELVF